MTQSGLQHPSKIDLVTQRPDGTVVLIMIEDRPWDGGTERLAQLQAKLNSYLEFALDEALTNRFPELKGRPLAIQLDCHEAPTRAIDDFLASANSMLNANGVRLLVNVSRGPSPP
jgi:hypothetical protein